MKKYLCFLVVSLSSLLPVLADVITPSQALQIAEDFLGEDLTPQHVRGMRGAVSAAEQENAPLYVISRGDDRGYVLVSGDDCLPAVIGYTDAGNFDADDLSPAYRDMLDCVTAAVTAARKAGAGPRRPVAAANDRQTIQPLITSHWNQGAPWNNLCPVCPDNGERAITGCVATAASQAIYYFRKDLPQELLATTPTYKGNGDEQCDVTVSFPKGTPIEYDLMFDSYDNNEPSDLKDAVALLCYAVGASSKLSYWHSTSGYISEANNAMKKYFGLSGIDVSRDNMSLASWETLIYKSLSQGRPLLFSGFTIDDHSGHAINLDGYDAKNGLWHFNFGWGGGGDGWYTLDLETGVNGFCIWQEIVHSITPTHPNVAAEMVGDTTLYRRVKNIVTANITNNGTVPVTGFKVYLMSSEKDPSSSSTAIASNKTTYVAPGETVAVTFEVRPTQARDYYMYVTDQNAGVLAHRKVSVVEPAPQLVFHGLTTSVSTETVETALGTYGKLNNNAVTLYAEVSNEAVSSPGTASIEFALTQWNAEQKAEVPLNSKVVGDSIIYPGEHKLIAYTFTKLPADALITGTVTATACEMASADTVVRFVVGEKSLKASEPLDGVVTLSGDWDSNLFASLSSDASVTAYDLRGITGIQAPLTAANPNALFYVSTPLTGSNVICEGQCADLRLTSGFDFHPMEPFRAVKAQFMPDFTPGAFATLILPFKADVPSCYLCRQNIDLAKSYFTNAVYEETLKAGVPYLIASCSYDSKPFTGENVDVIVSPDTTLTNPFVGTFTTRSLYADRLAPTNYILALNTTADVTTQYFEKQDSSFLVPPFTAVISSDVKKIRASVNDALDKALRKMSVAMAHARGLYDERCASMADSANNALMSLLEEGHRLCYPMQTTPTPITQYMQRLEDFCTIYPRMVAHVTAPVDYTGYIQNPSFETGNKSGWNTDSHASVRNVNSRTTFIARGEGQYFLHVSNANKSSEASQTIHDLPTGYYRLSVMVGSDAGTHINVFADDSVCAVPASELGKWYLTEAVLDSIYVADGELNIGVKADADWCKCDDFRLYYLGNGKSVPPITKVTSPLKENSQPFPPKPVFYDLYGRRQESADEMPPGFHIVTMSDGTVCKVFVK